ncbi:hypothetical protein [Pontibacter russatus]|uniref:hypothetical protein n=1 Tax=Pontibacter russatus TaxID=2694929 RepID=UPI0013796E8A|nr:hypothetical protein [Pontibacter russatus]
MKRLEYSEAERQILKQLIGKTAERVIYNFTYYILDFGTYYILFSMELENGISKSGSQEIKFTRPELISEKLILNDSDRIIADYITIDRIQILKTIIYWGQIDKEYITVNFGSEATNKTIENLISSGFSTEEEIMVKPSLSNGIHFLEEYGNVVDVGIRLQTKDKNLIIAAIDNWFGFRDFTDGFFWEEKNIDFYFSESYDLIEL